ncbi:MAG: hypothetical protein VKM17_06520, partial [Cyanobacteriota bacterium]|nr:hypothetical protein [Cyanobacteriota bacterium]
MHVHLISADGPELGCRLALADQHRGAEADSPTAVFDLTGEQLLAAWEPAPAQLRTFEAVPVALGLWEQLEPRLEGWFRLLQLAEREALLIPPLPGVEALLQCLFLAEQLDTLAPTSDRVSVLMPPPSQAMALLELARTGPDLVEGLLDPVLSWWDHTRQSLGGLEKLVGLDLPNSSSLRLEAAWRGRLEQMGSWLNASNSHQLTLALEAKKERGGMLRHRMSRFALRGTHPTRVLLHGVGDLAMGEEINALLKETAIAVAVVPTAATLEELASLLDQEPEVRGDVDVDVEAGTMSITLAGVRREELQVRQLKGVVVLLCGGYRRILQLPEALAHSKCSGAKLENGRLELRFKG